MKHNVIVLSGSHTTDQLDHHVRYLRPGGLLFVYGEPRWLPELAVHLSRPLVFKYWIVLDISSTHRGLLMFWKPAGRFHLNTDAVRVPHALCAACGRYLKDWGGKRHLMNPRGAALSDVWRDLPRRRIRDHIIPEDVLKRVRALTGRKTFHVVGRARPPGAPLVPCRIGTPHRIEVNRVIQADCIPFLESAPKNVFDLCFADPPYNLKKLYASYDDGRAEREYIAWCNRWLTGMARALRPGGSLFVLNLPKWAIHHATFLNRHLEFRHWIAWDALSEPRGKLMPAHYALLWYTKPGASIAFNPVPSPDSPKYCLRASCIQKRKALRDDEKVELSDVWFDIHRIKHKRDRDAHPCQLPERLMERIILLATNPGDIVFDPFCGTGTTAVVAKRLRRNFVVTDTDPKYVRIAQERLASVDSVRPSVRRPRAAGSKREVELQLQKLARRLGRKPQVEEIPAEVLRRIDSIYPSRGAAIKRCRVALTP
jgi:site-specific DNA-methyltransferase (adenine-specific)